MGAIICDAEGRLCVNTEASNRCCWFWTASNWKPARMIISSSAQPAIQHSVVDVVVVSVPRLWSSSTQHFDGCCCCCCCCGGGGGGGGSHSLGQNLTTADFCVLLVASSLRPLLIRSLARSLVRSLVRRVILRPKCVVCSAERSVCYTSLPLQPPW